MHCIWIPPPGDADYSTHLGLIKAGFTRTAKDLFHREGTLWQRRFWEHEIRVENDLVRHMGYLHYNPVKHGKAPRMALAR